jgi:F420H(2)-dependent quinone reductase
VAGCCGTWGALRLTTIGRKSGHQRSVIIGYLEDGPNLVALAMNGWEEGYPSWWLNLEAHPLARGRSVIGCGSAGSRSIRSWRCMPAGGRPRRP